jgi:hypothetical protein
MVLADLPEREEFRLIGDPNYPKVVYTKGSPFDENRNYFWCHGNDSKLHLIHKRAEVK